MKRNNKIIYSLIIVFIFIIIGAGIYYVVAKNQTENTKKDITEKALSEVDYLEQKIVLLFNKMNKIEYENYKISAENIENYEKSSEETNQNSENTNSGDNSKNSSSNSTDQTKTNDSNTQLAGQEEINKKYSLQATGILVEDSEIDWNSAKVEMENLYTSLPTITLDLYQLDVDQSDILNFNNEIDNLTIAIKEESKERTLDQLVKVYNYIVSFERKISEDEMKNIALETKQNIFNAYSKLDIGDWNAIKQDVQTAIDIFSKLLTDVNLNQEKQYLSNKIYIMLNELKNVTEKQEVDIFLIKYEKILEELGQI